MNTIISKDSVTRLLNDVRNIIKNPLTDNGIYYIHDDEDMLKGYAMIIGTSDTPYFGGFYFFEFNFPSNYPHSPPVVKYLTNGSGIRFNPNLYVCGKVCISILNTWSGEQWTSCQTISTILLTLCTVLCKNPLLNEPGVMIGHRDLENYNKIIEYANIDIAVCDVILKNKNFGSKVYQLFYNYAVESFLKNYDALHSFCIKKNEKEGVQRVTTGFYGMNVVVNYNFLINKLQDCKNFVSISKL
jgi:ubiquitin-protein ligase